MNPVYLSLPSTQYLASRLFQTSTVQPFPNHSELPKKHKKFLHSLYERAKYTIIISHNDVFGVLIIYLNLHVSKIRAPRN